MTFPTIPLFVFFAIFTFSMVIYSNSSENARDSSEEFLVELSTTSQNVSFFKLPSFSISNSSDASPFVNTDYTYDVMNKCALPVYDFWHPTIKKYVKEANPMKNCDKNWTKLTELEDGHWKILKEGANCKARCFEEDGFKGVKKHDWMQPGPIDCEFLETACYEKEKQIYGYLHTQVVKKEIPKPKVFANPPNVFVFLIDSLGFGMAKRSLPKTLNFLQNTLKSVEFPFINKVGENSQPNMFSLWFGKQVEAAKKVDGSELQADWRKDSYCNRYLNNETHIFKEFMDYGYVTMAAEDWSKQVIDSWPFCKGFKESPVHHSMRPFQLAYEGPATDITKRHMNGKNTCRFRDQPIVEYFQQWLEVYKDLPKFSWTWMNVPAHSDFNEVAWYDDFFLSFFERNRELFSNSFTFVMGDHGYRFGNSGLFSTEIGHLEMSNPYLAISVPAKLREANPEILRILEKNAKSLQTHYDTRATLLDILKFQPLTHFHDRSLIEIGKLEKGNSLLRNQPNGSRTCATLPIPMQYCICRTKSTDVDDPELRKLFGEKLVDHVNFVIQNDKLTSICEYYAFNETTTLTHLGTRNFTSSFKISVKVKGESNAHFDTLMMYNSKLGTFEFEKVTRLDTYGKTIDCTKDVGFNKLCYCKNQPKERSKRDISTWNPKFSVLWKKLENQSKTRKRISSY